MFMFKHLNNVVKNKNFSGFLANQLWILLQKVTKINIHVH